VEADVTPIVQGLIVAIVVIASALFAAWRLMPARTKLRVLDRVQFGGPIGDWLLRRRERVLNELTHGCSACSHASSHGKPVAPK
jgi:hypothetical protein